MASKLDSLLKVSIIAAVLFASASVGYYFLMYLPQRDARLDAEKQRADAELLQEKQRAAEEKQRADAELFQEKQRADAAKVAKEAAAQIRYKTCIATAENNYNALWATSCKRVAEEAVADHTHCLAQKIDKENCDSWYRPRDPSPNCALPRMLADDIGADLDKARSRCLQESKAGL